jgi:hypothetical protein
LPNAPKDGQRTRGFSRVEACAGIIAFFGGNRRGGNYARDGKGPGDPFGSPGPLNLVGAQGLEPWTR